MEQTQQNLMMADENGGKLSSLTRSPQTNNNGGNGTSSTRWTPTTDQIRILKDLYYNNEVRSPNADQIQRISARLRQYGKIEGKNVFYWFQNHKARERQKKRFNASSNNDNSRLVPGAPSVWKPSNSGVQTAAATKYTSSNSHLIYANDHNQMTGFGYGSITMEKSFRDCSISAGGSSIGHNFGWTAERLDHHLSHQPYGYTSPYAMYDQQKSFNTDEYHELLASACDQEYGDDNRNVEIETLPLFPMHREDTNYSFCHINSSKTDGWFHRDVGGTRPSLELSLNFYAGMDRI